MQIKIDGTEYDLVDIGTIDLDESCWFYELAGIGPEALEDMEGFNPKLVKALICLSIARAKPEVKQREIELVVGKLKLTELGEAFEEAMAESPPAESPASETDEEPPSSGGDSSDAGDSSQAEPDQASTGSRDSDTGAGSVHPISAASQLAS